MIQPADLIEEPLPDRFQSLYVAQSEWCRNATSDAIRRRTVGPSAAFTLPTISREHFQKFLHQAQLTLNE
jgi:hypothetical protein